MPRRSAKPETLRQAINWETTKNRYVGYGLCDRCAAQAAWAHQNTGDSWTTIHPPCEHCAQIVATFPHPTPSPAWRKTLRQDIPKVSGWGNRLGVAVGQHGAHDAPTSAGVAA